MFYVFYTPTSNYGNESNEFILETLKITILRTLCVLACILDETILFGLCFVNNLLLHIGIGIGRC